MPKLVDIVIYNFRCIEDVDDFFQPVEIVRYQAIVVTKKHDVLPGRAGDRLVPTRSYRKEFFRACVSNALVVKGDDMLSYRIPRSVVENYDFPIGVTLTPDCF